ncbi:class I SAM-dependent methyltransferase [Halostagnicola bangensis]
MTQSLQTYLEHKRTVDDRALNGRVWSAFVDGLAELAAFEDSNGRPNEPVRVLEIGGGVGTMIARLAERDALVPSVSYRLVDLDERNVEYARQHLPEWLEEAGYEVERSRSSVLARSTGERSADRTVEVHLEAGDAFEAPDRDGERSEADAVIASAVLDTVDLEYALGRIPDLLRTGGLLYAPITYDGTTTFSPPDPLDERLTELYNRHMDEIRDRPGSSRAGRELFAALDRPGSEFDLLEVGGSDWIVRPRDGTYPADEKAFLRQLLETIDGALAAYPETALAPTDRQRWVDTRLSQLERGELSLIARHLDVLARL